MTALRLVPCDGRQEPDPVVRHDALTARSRRPGLAHEELVIAPAPDVQSWLVPAAAADGIPAELWAMLVIESERVLVDLDDDPVGRLSVASALDEHARWSAAPADASTRLHVYAAALRDARGRASRASGRANALRLLVPYHSRLAWTRSATSEGLGLEEWALRRLVPAGRRHLWEAAAAERGETLAEWIVLGWRRTALRVEKGPV